VAAKGYVDMFMEGDIGDLNEEQQEAMSVTQHKLDHMVEIVEAMTMMHEATSPKQLIPVNMNDLSSEAIRRFQDQADKQEILLVSDLPPDWVYAIGDPEQIALVFDALLTNAFKFSKKGGMVSLRLQQTPESHAQVSIVDDGVGISKKDQNKIFSRFFQIDGSTTRKHGGLGIGLSLVKEIINSHGGKVWVESEPDAGAAFHFTLLPPDESHV
jgi:signal transduction histidine kinase